MKFQNTETWGFEHALRGMRNPKNSWDKSDSEYKVVHIDQFSLEETKDYIIGPNDMKLAQILIKGGSEHRKFLRQIFVSVDITAPLYWWKEMDTYKIGTTANSTSTMHKLTSKPITLDCFETDDFNTELEYYQGNTTEMLSEIIIEQLEFLRQKYLETKDKKYWKELVRWLPESWLQTRTFTCNYEVLHSIVLQRGHHKLETEWGNGFIKWCTSLPYAKDLIFYGEEREKIYNLYAQK